MEVITGHRIYVVVFESILIVPILFGNLLILFSIGNYRKLQTKGNILVTSLAVADLLVAVLVIPQDLVAFSQEAYSERKLQCLFRKSSYIVFFGASILNLCFVSVERFVAVVYPYRYSRHCGPRVLVSAVVVSWTVAGVLGMLPLSGLNYWFPGCYCDITLMWPFAFTTTVYLIYVSSIFITASLYTKVSRVAAKQRKAIKITTHSMSFNFEVKLTKRLKRTRIMGLVISSFIIYWLPYFTLGCLRLAGVRTNSTINLLTEVSIVIGACNSCVNWAIFGLMNQEFKDGFKLVLGRCKQWVTPKRGTGSETAISYITGEPINNTEMISIGESQPPIQSVLPLCIGK